MTFDVAVIGAGIVGTAVAREVARAGGRVVVFDRDEQRTHASWAAAGMLAPQAESDGPGAFFTLLLHARSVYPALVHELASETGIDVGYRTEGMLLLAFTKEDEEELLRRYRWQSAADLDVDRLSGEEAHKLEPELSPHTRLALRFRGDHQVDNRLLLDALFRAASAAGAEFRLTSPVRGVAGGPSGIDVELESGEIVRAEYAVLAAGSWSGEIRGLPRPLPVEPVHGELLGIETEPGWIGRIAASPRGYLVPRADGRMIAGTTVERVGFRPVVTVGGLNRVSAVAMEIAPAVSKQRVVSEWAGLRPGTPDGLPILGPDPQMPRLLYATGHFRNGILLAPLTGRIITDLALGRPSPIDLTPYRVDRF